MLGMTKKLTCCIAVTGGLALLAQQTKGPQWADRAEYDMEQAAEKDATPATRIQKLDQWKAKYPNTAFKVLRQTLYLRTYAQMNKPRDTFDAAKALLALDSNNLDGLGAIIYNVFLLQPASADDMSVANKVAHQVLDNLDTLFATPPQGVDPGKWQDAKKQEHVLAQNCIGWIAMQQKDYPKAEAEFTKSLQLQPNAGQISFWLGTVIAQQKNPDPLKQSAALYHFARAAAFDGPGAYALRKDAQSYLEKAYAQYHGSKEGLDKLEAQAKASALPAADFKVPSKVDIEKAQIEAEEKDRAAHPMATLWSSIKDALTGAEGDSYFNDKMKDAELPGGANGVDRFKGKLISMTPAVRPKELVLSIGDGTTPDVKLKFEAPLPGKMDPGSELSFEGVAKEFSKDPFMVTFEVDKSKLQGWEGKNAAPPAKKGVRRAAPKSAN